MTLIKPASNSERTIMLARLAVAAAKRIGFVLEPYDASAIKDGSGSIHWMFRFDEHENRVYLIQNGLQRLVDLNVRCDTLDLDDIDSQVQKAIFHLNALAHRI